MTNQTKHYAKNSVTKLNDKSDNYNPEQETVTKQNPLRIEQGKRLVEYDHRKKEELKGAMSRVKVYCSNKLVTLVFLSLDD